ncbi:SgcJ/EcaC family oxidoreductase [Streptomyces sp. AV19]|uniref:YybH family protein n=1 Tax=Streptomyces sp. AV19 TaxID=2793068 RepID=UPI002413859A|nr:SgcJ/EcaC family oxidoreductase [Streptomyces sp. AV19]MDG4534291.1 SgcJ/EcaC family oxidoreductase [Streptomyces sp. AV19]
MSLTPETEEAVRTVVRDLQDAFNAKDADALGAVYSKDATWTNAMGARADGREAIAEAARRVFPVLADQFARYEVVRMLPIRDDVIAVTVHQEPVTRDGEPAGGPKGAPLYVISREEDGWKISAGSNMAVNS